MSRTINPVVKRMIEQQPQTFERFVICAMLHSYRFYISSRDSICPFLGEKWRRDFATPRYNDLYPSIDACWRFYGEIDSTQDYFLPKPELLAAFADHANSGGVDPKVAQALMEEIESDFYREDWKVENFLNIVQGANLEYWLNLRVSRGLINRLQTASNVSFMQLDEISGVVAAEKLKLLQIQEGSAQSGAEILHSSIDYAPMMTSGIAALDAALGGGYERGTATFVAGINAGGKTTYATQALWEFASRGIRSVFITTEQHPPQIIHRVVSNAANIPITEFFNRKDISHDTTIARRVPAIPAWVWSDPTTAEKMRHVNQVLGTHVYCIDWSRAQGFSIVGNLEMEIDKLVSRGWDPEVLILDWIGGGLEKTSDRDKIRQLYQESADHVVAHVKKSGRTALVLAQLDKSMATNQKRPTMKMLSECKTMSNNYTNCFGISSLVESDDGASSARNLAINQFFNVDKARNGPGGLVPVEAHFKFQRFKGRKSNLTGGG